MTPTMFAPVSLLQPPPAAPSIGTGVSVDDLTQAIVDNLPRSQGKRPRHTTAADWYIALAQVIRQRMLDGSLTTPEAMVETRADTKLIALLSAEFITGPHLENALVTLGIRDTGNEALARLGQRLSHLLEQEEETARGSDGIGLLAACYMDSLATLNVPAIGYGVRCEFGRFDQIVRDRQRIPLTELHGPRNPWERVRSDVTVTVKFGGHTEPGLDAHGRYKVRWQPAHVVRGVAYDTPIPGYRVPTTNLLRLWQVEALDFERAVMGGGAGDGVDHKPLCETISKVLHPIHDRRAAGRRGRLAQEYFFISCGLQDIIRLHQRRGGAVDELHEGWAIQLNGTHAAIAVAELMRLLVDEHDLEWEHAWNVTQETCSVTNHSVSYDGLDTWSLSLFQTLLPRHGEIVQEINRRFLDDVRRQSGAERSLVRQLSLIDETTGPEPRVRMAHLAYVGSKAIDGGSLQTIEVNGSVMSRFRRLWPARFRSISGGVTPRRWIALANPPLAALITAHIGRRWVNELETEIDRLVPLASDTDFHAAWQAVKTENKRTLARFIKDRTGVSSNPGSLFDVHVAPMDGPHRQHLNVLHLITRYNRLTRGVVPVPTPRTVIFAGGATPGSPTARLILKLVHGVAAVINADPRASDLLKVILLSEFTIKNVQRVYPAADLAEQIAGLTTDTSDAGGLIFAMNGALTMGSRNAANLELANAVGRENVFLFGRAADEPDALHGGAEPRRMYDANRELRDAVDMIGSGLFSRGDRELFRPLIDSMLIGDELAVFADYESFIASQESAAAAYLDANRWTRMSILNVARTGAFSSDRAVREYCRDVWHVVPSATQGGWR